MVMESNIASARNVIFVKHGKKTSDDILQNLLIGGRSLFSEELVSSFL